VLVGPLGWGSSIKWESSRRARNARSTQRPQADRLFLNAVSVGFQPLGEPLRNEHGGMDYDAVELLEIACVPVPANLEALVIARSMAGYGTAPVSVHEPYVFDFAGMDEKEILISGR
jgi:hypothetical protein